MLRSPRRKVVITRQGIRCRFGRRRAKLPHLKHFVAYNCRHTFCTNALANGVGLARVAELMRHPRTEMGSRTDGHLADQLVHMREAARKAVGG